MPTGVLLDPLAGHSQLVGSQMHDVEGVHHLPGLRQLLGGGRMVAGEPIHGHDFHPVAEGLLPGGKPATQRLSGPSRDHVQQSRWPGAVHVRGQIDDDGDKAGTTVAAAVFPLVLIHTQNPHADQMGGIGVDEIPGLI